MDFARLVRDTRGFVPTFSGFAVDIVLLIPWSTYLTLDKHDICIMCITWTTFSLFCPVRVALFT